MKIWILTSEFPPLYGGGIGMYVDKVALMYSDKGEQVKVFVRDDGDSVVEKINENYDIVRFKHCVGQQYSFMSYWVALAYQYYEIIIEAIDKFGKPDIIEIQDYNAIGYYIMQYKHLGNEKLKDIPIVLHMHTPTFELDRINHNSRYKFPNYWLGQMEKFCMETAEAIMSPSQFLKEQVQYVIPDKNIEVINLPYDLKGYDTYERNFDSDTFLYIGRTEYRKGVMQMVKAADKLWEKGYKFKLKIIGGDTFYAPKGRMLKEIMLEKYGHQVDAGNLIFVGNIHPDKLNPEMLNARAVIIPSLYENFPYSCLTSMWLGSPMLVSAHGGQAEMVEKTAKNGLVFSWDIENDFEDKLIKFLDMSKEDLQKMSENSEKRIRKLCNLDDNYRMRVSYFKGVIKSSKSNDYNLFPVIHRIERKPCLQKVEFERNLLSIVIPYYNLGETIDETMDSALSSKYQNREIVIVNDGSNKRESIEKLNKYRNRENENIYIVDIENEGLANARNVGAFNAKGEYITFLDGDDLIHEDYYTRSVGVLEKNQNISFVYSWLKYFDNGEGIWPTFNTEFPYFLGANMLSAFAVARRSDFINYGLNKKEMVYGLEDYEGWQRMALNGCIGVSIPEPLVYYRVRKNSMIRQTNRNTILYLKDVMSNGNKEIYDKYGVDIFNLLEANGPGLLWNNPTLEYPRIDYCVESISREPINIVEVDPNKELLRQIYQSKKAKKIIDWIIKFKIYKLFV